MGVGTDSTASLYIRIAPTESPDANRSSARALAVALNIALASGSSFELGYRSINSCSASILSVGSVKADALSKSPLSSTPNVVFLAAVTLGFGVDLLAVVVAAGFLFAAA